MANIIRTETFTHNEWTYIVEMDAAFVVTVFIRDRFDNNEVVDRDWADAATADGVFKRMVFFYR